VQALFAYRSGKFRAQGSRWDDQVAELAISSGHRAWREIEKGRNARRVKLTTKCWAVVEGRCPGHVLGRAGGIKVAVTLGGGQAQGQVGPALLSCRRLLPWRSVLADDRRNKTLLELKFAIGWPTDRCR